MIGACAMGTGMFRVGNALEPLPEDRCYDNQSDAIKAMYEMVEAYGNRTPIAIWNDRDYIIILALCGQHFHSVA